MSPRDLDLAVVQRRLALMRDLLTDLEHLGRPTAEVLESDRLLRHAAERILVQLVELASSINSHVAATVLNRAPADYREGFVLAARAGVVAAELLPDLRSSVGLRNVLTHEYIEVDLEIVASSIAQAADLYGQFVRGAAAWVEQRRLG